MIVSALRDSGGELPGGFTPVNYLQGDGNAWIWTGITAEMVNKVKIVFQETELDRLSALFGSYSPVRFYFMNFGEKDGWTGYYAQKYYDKKPSDILKHTVELSNYGFWMDGVTVGVFPGDIVVNPSCKLSLFTRDASPGGRVSKAKLFEFMAYKDDSIVQHLVPVYDTESNRPALLDKVSGDVFYNNGKGEFLWG